MNRQTDGRFTIAILRGSRGKELLENVKMCFIRMIAGLRKFTYETRAKHFNLWALEDGIIRAGLIEVFKMVRCLSVVDIRIAFDKSNRTRKKAHSETEERSCSYRS